MCFGGKKKRGGGQDRTPAGPVYVPPAEGAETPVTMDAGPGVVGTQLGGGSFAPAPAEPQGTGDQARRRTRGTALGSIRLV